MPRPSFDRERALFALEHREIAADVLFQHAANHSAQTTASFITAACAAGTMTILGIWANGLLKLLCSLIGILVGYATAAIFRIYPQSFFTDYAGVPFFALPDPRFLSYAFDPSWCLSPSPVSPRACGLSAC